MELTAKTLQEVTFGAKVRGYDPAEVDDFIAAVAEGVDELQERLRRATERAAKAEQQLASAGTDAPPAAQPEPVAAPAPAASVGGSAEISKVWERAVAAAEQAMEEAKAEAQRLLDEARTRADTQLSDARHEAESTVSTAQSEASRISEESQAQLRIEITKLEGLRDQLNTDVAGLSDFVEAEKEKLRSRISDALTAIDHYGSGAGPLTEVSESPFGSAAATASATTESWAAPAATSISADEPEWPAPVEDPPSPAAWSEPEGSVSESETDADNEDIPNWINDIGTESASQTDWQDENTESVTTTDDGWGNSAPWAAPADSNDDAAGSAQASAPEDEDGDSDPFLAELRRAVQDDGPLGPREDSDGDQSIQDLYSADDDDRNGFFRRKK